MLGASTAHSPSTPVPISPTMSSALTPGMSSIVSCEPATTEPHWSTVTLVNSPGVMVLAMSSRPVAGSMFSDGPGTTAPFSLLVALGRSLPSMGPPPVTSPYSFQVAKLLRVSSATSLSIDNVPLGSTVSPPPTTIAPGVALSASGRSRPTI